MSGFTSIDWYSGGGYKSDPNAFLFSLTNKDNRPSKMRQKSNTTYSIICHPSYGPSFGGGHDLHICDSANIRAACYSKLGSSYQHPKLSCNHLLKLIETTSNLHKSYRAKTRLPWWNDGIYFKFGSGKDWAGFIFSQVSFLCLPSQILPDRILSKLIEDSIDYCHSWHYSKIIYKIKIHFCTKLNKKKFYF